MTNKLLQRLLLLIFLSAWSGFSFANITNYTYNQLNRLTRQTVEKGGQTLASYRYTLNANGQRSSLTEHSGRVSNYVYGKLGRLTTETITDALNGNHSAAYTYDKVGNRLTQTVNGTTTSYSYNANDWLLNAGSIAYTYDDNGNTLTETDGADVTTYAYDARNKLVQATTPSDAITYQYAPNGLRTQKTVGGTTVEYLVDNQSGYGDVVAEYVNGNKAKTYAIGDDLISQTVGNATFYYGYDGLGSTRMLFADTGAVSDSYDYTAFGKIHGQSGSTDNTFLFTGEQFDSNVGQYYLRARYYNQAIGRFTQLDTYQGRMSDPETLHKYLYTENNPINMVDPSGNVGIGSFGFSVPITTTVVIGAVRLGTAYVARTFVAAATYSIRGVLREIKNCSKSRGKKCRIPNLLVIGSDYPESKKHIDDAQNGYGSNQVWISPVVTYRKKQHSRTWLRRAHECTYNYTHTNSEGKQVPDTLAGVRQCDEYPFASTEEGGQRNYNRFKVSLRPISREDNEGSGRVWGRMVGSGKGRMKRGTKVIVAPYGPESFYIRNGKFGL